MGRTVRYVLQKEGSTANKQTRSAKREYSGLGKQHSKAASKMLEVRIHKASSHLSRDCELDSNPDTASTPYSTSGCRVNTQATTTYTSREGTIGRGDEREKKERG